MKDNLTRGSGDQDVLSLDLKDLRVKKTFTGLQHYCPALFYGMLQFVSENLKCILLFHSAQRQDIFVPCYRLKNKNYKH